MTIGRSKQSNGQRWIFGAVVTWRPVHSETIFDVIGFIVNSSAVYLNELVGCFLLQFGFKRKHNSLCSVDERPLNWFPIKDLKRLSGCCCLIQSTFEWLLAWIILATGKFGSGCCCFIDCCAQRMNDWMNQSMFVVLCGCRWSAAASSRGTTCRTLSSGAVWWAFTSASSLKPTTSSSARMRNPSSSAFSR